MTPERWAQIKRILADLDDQGPDQRIARFDALRAVDPALCEEVEAFLASEPTDSFLEPPTLSKPALVVGTDLGPYELQSLLGGGGMGEVWKAYDPKLQRTVAIKVLHDTDDAASRILAEARAASALNHNHICTIHEVGESDGISFIVMEHVEGKPLSELIPSDGLPAESIVRYGTQIADALAHAHEHGIVHRDLKSANVVITPEAQIKLIDFGIAVPLSKVDAAAVTRTQESPASSVPAGTLAYMAPEVLNGQEATVRSDIWALGVLLYEMASGRLPFDGETPLDIVSAIARDTPRVLPRRVSSGLRSVVQRCLQKEPGSRYSSVVGVHGALEAIQSEGTSVSRRTLVLPPLRPLTRSALGLGLVALVALMAVVAFVLRFGPAPPRATVPRLANPVQLTFASTVEDNPAWSPDGQMIAYQESGRAGAIWVMQVNGGSGINRTPDEPGPLYTPSWAPDGSAIIYWAGVGRGVKSVPTLSGSPRTLIDAGGRADFPRLLAGGAELAHLDDANSMKIVNVTTGASRRFDLPGAGDGIGSKWASWSPDEKRVAYWVGSVLSSATAQVWILDTTTGEGVPVTSAEARNISPSWSPDGRTLYFVSNRGGSGDLWQQLLTRDSRPEGEPARLTTGIGMVTAAMSPDGAKIAYTKGGTASNVWRVPIANDGPAAWTDAEALTSEQANIENSSLSSDGTRLALDSTRSGNFDIWARPLAGGPMQQLTTDPSPDFAPTWSPNGDQVAFISVRGGNRDIWVMSADGGTARQLTTHDARELRPAWSPNGTDIVFYSNRDGKNALWVIDAAGGPARLLVESGNYPCWSPDGRWVAYIAPTEGGDRGLWRVPSTGGEPELLLSYPGADPRVNLQGPVWSTSGQEIYVREIRDGVPQISALTLGDRTQRDLTNFTGKHGGMAEKLDTDGEYIYFRWRQDLGDIWVMDVTWGE